MDREVIASRRGGGEGEAKEHDQGDKGPVTRARSKLLSPVWLQWTKEARRRASSSKARARDRGNSPDVTFARALIWSGTAPT